ncbi:MAG: serine hydrolase [Myxococcota bacterium]|nr:serine hydrolase [Myxococcota bacterium]
MEEKALSAGFIWLLVSVLMPACSDTADDGTDVDLDTSDDTDTDWDTDTDVLWPMPDWPTGDPTEAGFDVEMLEAATDYSKSIGGQCLLVIRDGKLVWEQYFNDGGINHSQKSWSIAKSFTSALIGIALGKGMINSVDEPAANYLPEWQDQEDLAPITIRHLLNMVSGLRFNLEWDNLWTVLTYDMTEEALGLPAVNPPDTVYQYSNHGTQVLNPILENASGMDQEDFAWQYLWGPLGFNDDTYWFRDGAGNVTAYMNINTTCRDFARFGYLYLHGGFWNGEQIVPKAYVEASLKPSSSVNSGHSHMWWLNGYTPYINATQEPSDGIMFPGVWTDLFGCKGVGQNFIDVVPSTNTIYVHMRPAPHALVNILSTNIIEVLENLYNDGKDKEHYELLKLLYQAD